ncbi:MAG: COG4223 family protein [Bdellovibrionales bacterium]
MNDLAAPQTEEKKDTMAESEAPVKKPCSGRRWLWGLLIALLVLVVLAIFTLSPVGAILVGGVSPLPEVESIKAHEDLSVRLDDLEHRTQALEAHLNQPTEKQAASLQPSAEPLAAATQADEIEALKTGLVGLSGALTALQQELDKSTQITSEDRMNLQTGLSTALAFLQLEQTALAGRPFEKEMQVLRQFAEGDQVLLNLIDALSPFAPQGIVSTSKLYGLWYDRSAQAQTAIRKASAHTWYDRLIVALESLVSIRSLHEAAGPSLAFSAIGVDLEENHLAEAVTTVQTLPAEAQTVLGDWIDRAKARLLVETTIDTISTHLIERGSVESGVTTESIEPPPQAEPAPSTTQGAE